MVYHMTGGSWGFLIRRILEAGMRTLPLLALFFLPIALGIDYLYVWAQPDAVAASPQTPVPAVLPRPHLFLDSRRDLFPALDGDGLLPGFLVAQAKTRREIRGWRGRACNSARYGAVAYGISLHFAAVDWGMSLQPEFHSTIWGPLFAAGQLLSGLAFALVVLAWLVNRPPLAEVVSLKVRNDLASLLLTLLILWAYMAWFQFMLIWIANLPVDVIWYLPRASTPWLWVIWAIVLLHFAVPFFLLLMRPIKRNSKAVAWIAGLILFMQLAFKYYQVIPEVRRAPAERTLDGFSRSHRHRGIWLAHFMMQLRALSAAAVARLQSGRRHCTCDSLDAEEAAREEATFPWITTRPRRRAVRPVRRGGGDPLSGRPHRASAARHEPKDIRLGCLLAV